MLPEIRDYSSLYKAFEWLIPDRFNIAEACCDRWAATQPDATAIIDVRGSDVTPVSFAALQARSNRFANMLAARGIGRGDRVGIMLPQGSDVAAAHMGVYKCAAIAVPLAILFGVDAIAYRLQDAGIKVLITRDDWA